MMKKVVKSLVPTKILKKIGELRWQFKNKLRHLFSSRSVLINIYYALFSREFDREKKGVILGIKNKRKQKTDFFLVTRNIHRLEKGLTMKPRRALFGEGFIKETYEEFLKINPTKETQYNWYRDVLNEYFKATGDSTIITPLRNDFNKRFQNFECSNFKPFKREDAERLIIGYDDLIALNKRRRSVRWYENKLVPRLLIEKALKVGLYAPSACNRQPFEFLVFDDPERINKIASIPMGTAGFYQQFPMLIVVVGDLSAYDSERDRHVIYIDGSLCTMGFVLALETLNLSSCIINWPDIESLEKRMYNELKLPPYKRPLFLISVGYADPNGIIPYSMKKSPKEIITYN